MKTIKSTMTIFILLLSSSYCISQGLIFTKQIKNSENYGTGLHIIGSVIHDDNFFVVGTFSDTVTIDTVIMHSTSNPNWYDCNSFIAKYNQFGELTKSLSNTGTGIFTIENIKTDQIGNIYLSAFTQGNIIFDTASFTTNIGIFSYLIFKLDSNLNIIWYKTLYNNFSSGSSDIRIDNLTLNKNNEVILVGSALGNYNLDGIPITGNNGKPFLAKLNPSNGVAQWVNQIYGNYTCVTDYLKVTTDENDDILLTGKFSSDVNPNLNYLVFNLTDTLKLINATTSTFLSKFQNTGTYLWAKKIDTISPFNPTNISTDTNNNIFLGANKLYKYNSIGNLIWSKEIVNGGIADIVNNKISNYSVISFLDSVEYDNVKIYDKGYKSVLVKTNDITGNLEWHSKAYDIDQFSKLYTSGKGVSALTGLTYYSLFEKNLLYDNDKSIGYMICINDSNYFSSNSNIIKGKTFSDTNNNCLPESDPALSGIGVIVYPGPYYSVSDSFGNFEIKVNSGSYQVRQLKTIGHAVTLIQTCGISPNSVLFSGIAQIDSTSNLPNQYNECGLLKSYINRSMMTDSCVGNGQTNITIKNLGLDTVFNVVAKVKYPGYTISPLYSIPIWSGYSVIDSTVTFSVSYIAPNTSFHSDIFDTIDCLGVTSSSQFLFSLRIEPINNCYLEDSIYNYDTFISSVVQPVEVSNYNIGNIPIEIYPNPTNSKLNIKTTIVEIKTVVLYNMMGQKRKEFKFSNGSNFSTIDISDFINGFYIVKIIGKNGETWNCKILKQ